MWTWFTALGSGLKFALVGIIFGLGFFSGVEITRLIYIAGEKRDLQDSIDTHIANEKTFAKKAEDAERALSEERFQNLLNNADVKNEIKKPDYNCKLPVSGKLLINKNRPTNGLSGKPHG